MVDSTDETLDAPAAELGASPSLGTEATVESGARSVVTGAVPGRGAVVGRYVVLSKLGAGAMGVVLAAYDPELDRKVALKLLKTRPGSGGEAARARLQREAQALAKLNHSNVVGVHDVGVHEGQVFVAMEFVDGQTLGDWMKSAPGGAPHPWREVVKVFEAAGRGLAAAHKEGLIHRDFKPDNVMLGDDGRVRVMDFGLARADEDDGESRGPMDLRELDTGNGSALDTPLTRTGALMGTPAYMSPEQFSGMEVTARSDQFGYCVALFEALHGARPFSGETLAQLAVAVTEGVVVARGRDTTVPKWVAAAVRRGLSVAPEQRFVDMEALLAELAAGEGRRRRGRTLAVVGALGVATALGFGWGEFDERRRIAACDADGRARTNAVWNPAVRKEVRDGLLGTGVPFAETTVERTLPYFEAHAEALREAQTEVCLETRVKGVWSEDLLDRATWCLDERRMEVESLAAELAEADEESIHKAVTAAARFENVAPCRVAAGLNSRPTRPDEREALVEVRRRLARAEALSSAGKFTDALEVAEEALTQSESLGWSPLTAAARLRVGEILGRTGDYARAAETAEEAYFEAEASGEIDVAAAAASVLVFVVGVQRSEHEEGRRWARHADVALTLLGEPEDGLRRIELDGNLGGVHRGSGAYDEATALMRRVLAVRERVLGPDHPDVATALNDLAAIQHSTGAYDQAKDLLERALEVRERALGADHPFVGDALNNLGAVYYSSGAYDEAREWFERALGVKERALGPDHASVAATLNNLGNLNYSTGAYDEARAQHLRALEIKRRALGPDHLDVALSHNNLGSLHHATGAYDEARSAYDRALEIKERVLGRDHPTVATSLVGLAAVDRATGAYDDARARYERALGIRERVLGLDHENLGDPLVGLAEVALAQDRPADARARAERALAVSVDGPAANLAQARYALARALWVVPADPGPDPVRARALAEQAADAYRGMSGKGELLAEVTAWLAARE